MLKIALQLVHLRREIGFQLCNTGRGRILLGLQCLPVGNHRLQVLVACSGHACDSVHTVCAAIGKAGDYIAQTLNVRSTIPQAGKIRIVILPILDLAGERVIDRRSACCNDVCGLIPKGILSAYGLLRSLVCVRVGFGEFLQRREHFINGSSDFLLLRRQLST